MYKASPIWDKINKNFSSENIDLENFRSINSVNSKITTWNPYEPSSRYLKSLLINIVSNPISSQFYYYYSRLNNTDLGNPISVCYERDYNLDYILSVFEFIFLADQLNLSKVKNVCEIGAGFGRTAHTILTLNDSIENYFIIDLPNFLQLSEKYLQQVLEPRLFKKCSFIQSDNTEFLLVLARKIDLFINIDSFAEMLPDVIKNYLKLIDRLGSHFYCKNPVGKYLPSTIDLQNQNDEDVQNIFQTGLCRDVVDIFNKDELERALEEYSKEYCPSTKWQVLSSELAHPFIHYGNVIYKNV